MAKFQLGDIKRGGILAMASAVLFGASTPAAKAIIANVNPLILAGLLYLGSGCGVAFLKLTRLLKSEQKLKRQDVPWLVGTIVFGGMLGPALLMYGLTSTSGAIASLLLTLEGVFTAVLAWAIFKEPFNRRIGIGMIAIFAGAVLLALRGPAGHGALTGAFAIGGACLCWAIDNNCTSKISHADAPTLASIKGVTAGLANIGLGFAAAAAVPSLPTIGEALLIGLLGYGVSLILFVLALREIGAARTGAYYSTAPFIGAIIGLCFLHEPWSTSLLVAGGLMAFGVWLHLTEPAQQG